MLDKPREFARHWSTRIDARLDAVAALPPPPVFLSVQKLIALSVATQVAVCASVVIHLFLLLAIGGKFFDPKNFMPPHNAMDVVLVNAKSAKKPTKADALAQANLDGGGNTDENRRAKTPLPAIEQSAAKNEQIAQQRVKQLEQEVKTLMTQANSSAKVIQGEINQQPSGAPRQLNPTELLQRLDAKGILGGLPLERFLPDRPELKDALLFATTELNDAQALDELVEACRA